MRQVFDRYNIVHPVERIRYEERMQKSRRGLREDYDHGGNIGVGLFIIFFAIVLLFFFWGEEMSAAVIAVLATAAVLAFVAAFIVYYLVVDKTGDDEKLDLYIYGVESDDFLLLNPLYEEMERIHPGEIQEIRILAAMRPTTRQKHIDTRTYREITHYEYFGEGTENGSEHETTPYPMAVLCTGAKDFDWRWIDDPIFRRDLQQWLTFVPLGTNAQNFVHLLRNTACPVFLVQEVYHSYWPQLDALFTQSGMDLSRLQIMQEETRQTQMIRIIG